MAALARVGQLYANYILELYNVPVHRVPKAPRGIPEREFEEMWQTTCGEGLEGAWMDARKGKRHEAFTTCANLADSSLLDSDWARLCHEELNLDDPRGFPLFVDIRPQPGYVQARIAAAGPQLRGTR